MRPDKVLEWFFCIGLIAIVLLGFIAIGNIGCRGVKNSRALEACRDKGGRIDHYDPNHEDYWRCDVSAEVTP